MIRIPHAWRLQPGVDSFTLLPPEGAGAGHIKYRERVTPLLRIGQIIQRCLAEWPGFTASSIHPPERLVTHEGEHAALVEIEGREGNEPALRFVGVTFADDFYALLGALCRPETEASTRALVRALVEGNTLELGVRRRRYEHMAPAGWEPLTSGLVTEWFPPGFPDDASVLTVYPAGLRHGTAAELHDLELARLVAAGCAIAHRAPPRAIESALGLHGQLFATSLTRAEGDPVFKHMAILLDARHAYPLDLAVQHGLDARRHLDILEAVATSIVPVPPPHTRAAGPPPVSHWLS